MLRLTKYLHLLDLVIGHTQAELLHARLDGVPSLVSMLVSLGNSLSGDGHTVILLENETYRFRPKSSGLMISYVEGLLRMACQEISRLPQPER